MRYDVADFTKIIHIVYIIILHAVEKNFCNLPSSFKELDKIQFSVNDISEAIKELDLFLLDT